MPGDWRRRLKSILGVVLFRSGLYRTLLRDRAVVVVFHRVDDRYPGDPITCTRREFESFCAFFRRYFHVVGFEELLDRLEQGREIGRHLAITFDDGYKDNHDVAAAHLKRCGLPATFFIAANLIGSDTVAPWDAEREIHSEWMSWDDVRSLRAMGFEVGAHTLNHVDLGRLTGPDALAEISESGRRLETEIGEPIRVFSYPFGGPAQITEVNRDAVRRAGYRCCASAHSGVVAPGADPFRLKRQPISSWFLSPYQFGFESLFMES